jgi:hypothetical protein
MAARYAEIALGVVFFSGAMLKAGDINLFAVQIGHYGVVPNKAWLPLIALFVLALETGLGCALVTGLRLRKLVLAAVAGLLILFSGLIAYAWAFHGLKDCGCFGALEMSPGISLLKNAVLALLVGCAFACGLPPDKTRRGQIIKTTTATAVALALGVYAHSTLQVDAIPIANQEQGTVLNPDPQFTQFKFTDETGQTYDLGQGDYLVAVMSMTCEDCQASVPAINELQTALSVPLVALCFEEHEGALREFREKTQPEFPLLSIGDQVLLFNNLIGDEPPRFHAVRNGLSLKHWDMAPPSRDEIGAVFQN